MVEECRKMGLISCFGGAWLAGQMDEHFAMYEDRLERVYRNLAEEEHANQKYIRWEQFKQRVLDDVERKVEFWK